MSHMKSEMATPTGGSGPTSEKERRRTFFGERRRRTTNDDAATATIEVGSPTDLPFFAISFRFARLLYRLGLGSFAIY